MSGTVPDDNHWMRLALSLAERGRGSVEPNPLVGAVVLDRAGQLVGSGWHTRFGDRHAEVMALDACGDVDVRDGTLVVTLEPCCHWGKTPPCTDRILASKIRRVVAAMPDPYPRVAGGGIQLLRAAGVDVRVGVCEAEGRELNAPYLTLLHTGRPYLHLKWAMTLDGRVATRTGESKWISSEASRKLVHTLRGRMDAIVVGSGTVRADDPLLTARPPGVRTPARVVISAEANLPDQCQLRASARDVPVIVFTHSTHVQRLAGWKKDGCEVIGLPHEDRLEFLAGVLAELGGRRMTNVLVEGGSSLFGSFLDLGLGDEFHVFVAPKLVGGEAALSPVGGAGKAKMADAIGLTSFTANPLGDDVYLHGVRREVN